MRGVLTSTVNVADNPSYVIVTFLFPPEDKTESFTANPSDTNFVRPLL